jgi:site-specific recombinase XerD
VSGTFFTHLLELGYDIRTVPVCVQRTGRQELLGHQAVRTTKIHTPILNRGGRGVHSPADTPGSSPGVLCVLYWSA